MLALLSLFATLALGGPINVDSQAELDLAKEPSHEGAWLVAYTNKRPECTDKVLGADTASKAKELAVAAGLEVYEKHDALFFVDPSVLNLKSYELRLAWLKRLSELDSGDSLVLSGKDLESPEVREAIRALGEFSPVIRSQAKNPQARFVFTAFGDVQMSDGKRSVSIVTPPSDESMQQMRKNRIPFDPQLKAEAVGEPSTAFEQSPVNLHRLSLEYHKYGTSLSGQLHLLSDLDATLAEKLAPVERALDEAGIIVATKLGKSTQDFLGGLTIPPGTSAADLPTKTREYMEDYLSRMYSDLGFSSADEAGAFFRNAKVSMVVPGLRIMAQCEKPGQFLPGAGRVLYLGSGK